MNVDFNNLRKQACFAYDRLARKLNNSIEDGEIRVDADYIQREMDDLRELVMAATCVYKKDDPEFKEVWNEVQEATKFQGGVAWFNNDMEEED